MVKREIKKFKLDISDIIYECEAPATINSILRESGNDYRSLSGVISFDADMYVEQAAFVSKHTYIRVKSVKQPASLYLNGNLVGELCGDGMPKSFDISGRAALGANTVSIRFNLDECDRRGLVGVFEPIEVLRFSEAIIDRVHLLQTHEDGKVNVSLKLDLLGTTDNVRAVATLVSSAGQIYYAGLTRGKGSIHIPDPLYWWPRGFGVQNLYKLTVNLYGEVEVEDSFETKIGLSTITTSSAADGSTLLINGVRFLPMGATYEADECPDVTSYLKKEEALVTSAAMSQYNALVLPLGAVRPSERFFELCDIHGIVVIEEIDSFDDDNIERISRISHHASYGIADIVACSDIERLADCLNNAAPNLEYSILDKAHEYIKAPSLPSEKTLRSVVPEGERNLFSESVEAIADEGAIADMLLSVSKNYPYPATLSDFAYASALASAKRVGERVKECRMSLGETGRAVFSKLGDGDVRISSSAIDSFARWKPLQYYSARYFAPVALYAEVTPSGILFSASNEQRNDFIGTIEYRIADSSNHTIYKNSEACEFSAMSARRLFTRDLSEYISGHEREYYLEYYLKEGSSVVSRNTLLFVPEKYFKFEKPNINWQVSGFDRKFSITLTSDKFIKGLEIDFDGADAVLSENYIDVTSDAPIKISFTVTGALESASRLNDAVKIRTVQSLSQE